MTPSASFSTTETNAKEQLWRAYIAFLRTEKLNAFAKHLAQLYISSGQAFINP